MATAYDKLIRVTITQPGMQTYSGYLRRHRFENGVSVELIPVRMALLLGASMSVVDEEGQILNPNTYKFEQIGEVSAEDFPSVNYARASDVEDEKMAKLEADSEDELSDKPLNLEDDDVGFHEVNDEHDDPRVWSLEELEAIADSEGISGLREVGDLLKVKGRSIGDLIQSILKSQMSEPAEDSDGSEAE